MNEPEVKEKTYTDFVLPPSVISKLDVSRLLSEAERVDNELTTASVRAEAGGGEQPTPRMSGPLADFLGQNQLGFSSNQERSELIKQLRLLKDNVPVIHMTFATEADGESLQQLAGWLRGSVHPQAVIAAGVQPALVAGVYLRTPNHVHDFSLRTALKGGRGLLVKELEALHGES